GECMPPDRLQYAELKENSSAARSFPVGTKVSYVCRPGYVGIPGKSKYRTCGEDLQWSPRERFCTERKCSHPGELLHGFINVTSLTFGSTATFSCEQGFRLRGTGEITCVVKNKGVDWNRDLPLCERIPCEPPPSIANGHYTEEDSYTYETSVTYTCDKAPPGEDPFSLIGQATIFCGSDAYFNGVWSGPPPQCKVVKCGNPTVENGRKISGFASSYSYRDTVMFECDPGYSMIGPEIITCGENNTWLPTEPTCEKSKPLNRNPNSFENIANLSGLVMSGPNTSGFTPHISHGGVIDGQKPSYFVGDFITIECYSGYTLHGESRIMYVGENKWIPEVPTCRLSAYIVVIICVIVAVVVFLAAFWVYKKFCSQNGKRDSTPCTAEYKICKA
ncbi:CR1L protein, partial [Heliornis fulica]|nr:CR1L protein [Heliornis fulica]